MVLIAMEGIVVIYLFAKTCFEASLGGFVVAVRLHDSCEMIGVINTAYQLAISVSIVLTLHSFTYRLSYNISTSQFSMST